MCPSIHPLIIHPAGHSAKSQGNRHVWYLPSRSSQPCPLLLRAVCPRVALFPLSSMTSFPSFSLSFPSRKVGWVSDAWVWYIPAYLQPEWLPALTSRPTQTHWSPEGFSTSLGALQGESLPPHVISSHIKLLPIPHWVALSQGKNRQERALQRWLHGASCFVKWATPGPASSAHTAFLPLASLMPPGSFPEKQNTDLRLDP